MAINQAQLVDLLAEHRRQNWSGIQTPEWQERIVLGLAQNQEPRILKRIAPFHTLPSDPMILDLGSGVGNFVVACRNQGLRAFGVEPDRIGQNSSITALGIASRRLDSAPFAAAVGEQLPFPDSTFDLVVMDQMIEHVANQKRVLAEALRVLKPGGALYVACPNYLRFYEPHYKIRFLPLTPKFLGSIYLRLRGRDPVLLSQLIYTTNWRVRRLLAAIGITQFQDLNCEGFLAKCGGQGANPGNWKGRVVKQLANKPVLGNLVLWAASLYVRLREGGSEMLAWKDA
jgi:SAM-dependent methyltransferase